MNAKLLFVKAKVPRILPDIRKLIETARQHVAAAADLTMVGLYWNIGRIITQDIQSNERRAEYGDQLLKELAVVLTHEYGSGYSRANLQDMRRFVAAFEICQTLSSKSAIDAIRQTVSAKSERPDIP